MTSIEEKFEESKRLGLQIAKESAEEDRLMTLSVGPQHPGSGHFRFVIKVDGDYIVFCDPDPGYVHRGEEKMCEYRNVIQNIPHLERPVIHDSANINYSYSLAIEELVGVEVPRRGHEAAPGEPEPGFLRDLQGAAPGCLRALANRRREGQFDAVHAA